VGNWFSGFGDFVKSVVTPVASVITGLSPAAPPIQVQQPTYVPTPQPAVTQSIKQTQEAKSFLTMKYAGIPLVLLLAGGGLAVYFLTKK